MTFERVMMKAIRESLPIVVCMVSHKSIEITLCFLNSQQKKNCTYSKDIGTAFLKIRQTVVIICFNKIVDMYKN